MTSFARFLSITAATLLLAGVSSAASAQQPWSTVPGACASTDNNFEVSSPSVDFPIARFRVPGGALAFNGFHDGFIAVICQVDNPRDSTSPQRWNQLQVTYRDPDGLGRPDGIGTEYQAYAELVRVSKTTGAWQRITQFDSNVQCAGGPTLCQADNTIKSFTVPFTHTFDFENFTYAVQGRLFRALATFSLSPAIYQLRLQAAPGIFQAATTEPEVGAR